MDNSRNSFVPKTEPTLQEEGSARKPESIFESNVDSERGAIELTFKPTKA